MGIRVGRIVKEFVFKSLIEQDVELIIHGQRKQVGGPVINIQDDFLEVEIRSGSPELFKAEEKVQVYFFFQNNYHTFSAAILDIGEGRVKISHPDCVYKNPQRKYERIKTEERAEVFFSIKGQKVELNFPRTNKYVEPSPDDINTRLDLDF